MKTFLKKIFYKSNSIPNEKIPLVEDSRPCKLEAILNIISDGALIIDKKLILQSVNQKAQELFNIGEYFKGNSLLLITRSTELEAFVKEIFSQNNLIEREMKLYIDGDQRHFHIRGSPVNDGEEVIIILTEVTRLYKLEQVRKDFAANVSHELRTPIQLIKGYTETLLDSSLKDREQVRRIIKIILKNTQTMENLTTDLLSLVTLEEKGSLSFEMEEVFVFPILEEARSSVEMSAKKKKISIILKCNNTLKASLYAPFIIQGVVNLLDNAIKYSPPESRVWLSAEQTTNSELLITVRDEGIGIPTKHLERIFERFYRVDPSRSKELGGTGLGLAIVRHISLAHNGTVSAESHAGEGSVFKIRIPLSTKINF